ncbi:MAG: hypothetical protein ACK4ZJ_19005, partial [Allorhizobium sp.]
MDLVTECKLLPHTLGGPRLDIAAVYVPHYHARVVQEVSMFTARYVAGMQGAGGSAHPRFTLEDYILLIRAIREYCDALDSLLEGTCLAELAPPDTLLDDMRTIALHYVHVVGDTLRELVV